MRKFIDAVSGMLLVEAKSEGSPSSVKSFLLEKMIERAEERRLPLPSDLTGACKFAALFAQMLHGGEINAHDFHTWLDVGGRVIDYCEDAADVLSMKAGEVHSSARDYAKTNGIDFDFEPTDLYEDDDYFRASWEFQNAMESCLPRVQAWYAEWSQRV